jgi:pyruvate, orthophosphate dikinase
MAKKYIYFYEAGKAEGRKEMYSLLGGKGANLAEMCRLGLPVPPGFTITTEVCEEYIKNDGEYPSELDVAIEHNLKKIEKITGKRFGDKKNPLLVSVRSGAAVSMPGMMDTILNLGLNDQSVEGLSEQTGNERFAWDCYRRFIQMFGNVAKGVPAGLFENELEDIKRGLAKRKKIDNAVSLEKESLNQKVPDTVLDVDDIRNLVNRYQRVYKEYTHGDFPQDAKVQLKEAINAVFASWNNPRARSYREIHSIKGLIGTAVNVQSMVYGNAGNDSGTGVGFTRDPSTGDHRLYGEYLMNAQGEDVVAGIRTPSGISEMKKKNSKIYKELDDISRKLEEHYRDMQDFEFTIEGGKLYLLQTRAGKRSAQAAVKIAVDMVKDDLIDKRTAIMHVDPHQIDQLLHPAFDSGAEGRAEIFSSAGLPASPGAAVGQAVFTPQDAENWNKDGRQVILCQVETSPEAIRGMQVSQGILTVRGGMTSHAAVVSRGMGKCCVAGAGDIVLDESQKFMRQGEIIVNEGDWISLNGSKGVVYLDKIDLIEPKIDGPFAKLMKWTDEYKKLGIWTNADTPKDTQTAVDFGAEGVGLCRTEHMFFDKDRIGEFRKVILTAPEVKKFRGLIDDEKNEEKKKALEDHLRQPFEIYIRALNALMPLQRSDFESMFETLRGRPCTIRLLDPPLHEFLPHEEFEQRKLAHDMGISFEEICNIVKSLKEINPMLGHRGCRLGIVFPEITWMQTKAILEAALNVKKRGINVQPEIMIPLVGSVKEFNIQKQVILNVMEGIKSDRNIKKLPFDVKIGTMIEVPRAAVTADELAEEADFFFFRYQ